MHVCGRVIVKSARKHCISSCGQVLNLCDPARDYGGSERKMGLEAHPSSLVTDSLSLCDSVLLHFFPPFFHFFSFCVPTHDCVLLQIKLTTKQNYTIY